MSTDVHRLPHEKAGAKGVGLFWTLIVIAILAAAVAPFMPPRALTDTTQDLQ